MKNVASPRRTARAVLIAGHTPCHPALMQFIDRDDAGQALSKKLEHYRDHPDVIVLGLPRGGVPVAYQVSQAINAPLDIFIVRKLGFPAHPEYAMGAIASGGIRVLNPDARDVPQSVIDTVTTREREELERREALYRGNRPPSPIRGRIVIIVDDGLATGSSMRAAVTAVKQQEPQRIVVAAPVAAADTCDAMLREVDEVVCVLTPEPFRAVGLWYEDFNPTTDDDVRALMTAAWASQDAHTS